MIRNLGVRLWLVLLVALASAGCDLVQGIFKAGFFVGILVVGLAIFLILFLVMKVRR